MIEKTNLANNKFNLVAVFDDSFAKLRLLF